MKRNFLPRPRMQAHLLSECVCWAGPVTVASAGSLQGPTHSLCGQWSGTYISLLLPRSRMTPGTSLNFLYF